MAATAELDRMSVKELREMLQKIDVLIVDKQKTERVALREKMVALAAESGLSIDEIMGGSKSGKRPPVPAKFRNPENADETWSGRGRMPNWMTAKLTKRGVTKEDFVI
jgi:DNA-binding protein H-NS